MMLRKEEIFEAWARPGSPWSAWAKPILFAHAHGEYEEDLQTAPLTPHWAPDCDGMSALILDLPGDWAVRAGLAMATKGYEPVPLFNAIPVLDGRMPAAVDVWPTLNALIAGAAALRQMPSRAGAPPVFLLDANRTAVQQRRTAYWFDNRSVCLPTDFPSGAKLRANGIQRVLLIQAGRLVPQDDLSVVLEGWLADGLSIDTLALARTEGAIPDGRWRMVDTRPRACPVVPATWFGRLARRLRLYLLHRIRPGSGGEFGRILQATG